VDVEKLKAIVELLEGTDVSRLEWQSGNDRLVIRRGAIAQAPAAAAAPAVSAPHAHPPVAIAAANEPAAETNFVTIVSPLVGTFYRSPSPEEPAFVEVGQRIEKGQVLCIVEAMKLMNQIKADHSGRVVEILVKNAQPVEFDQPLFRIDPNG
jgi:acetyl-CoA carboxylase biotin carboxyl carrier protein